MKNREKLMRDIAEGKITFSEAKFKKYFDLPDDWDWDYLANVPTREIEDAIWYCNSHDINEIRVEESPEKIKKGDGKWKIEKS